MNIRQWIDIIKNEEYYILVDKYINAIKFANKLGSDLYGGLNTVYNRADEAVGGKLPYGIPEIPVKAKSQRKAGERFQSGKETWTGADEKSPVTEYVNNVPDKGLIPVPTLNPSHEALASAGKYALGPLGRHFRVLRSPETAARLQEQVEAAVPVNGKLIYQAGDPGYEDTKFSSNWSGGGVVGQFIGLPQLNNEVTIEEPYDTNRDVDWHHSKMKGHLKDRNIGGVVESAGNMLFRHLGDIGWANKYPRGKVQTIGELPPGHPYYRGEVVSGTKN